VRELKGLGASSSGIRNRPAGLYGRRLLKHLNENYALKHGDADGRIHATFEVLYAQAWYAEAPRSYDHMIPIEQVDGC